MLPATKVWHWETCGDEATVGFPISKMAHRGTYEG